MLKDAGARPKFIDIEDGSGYLDVERISPTPETWDELLQVLRDDSLWQGIDAVVVDSLTKAEELAVAWTLANVPHPDKQPTTYVKSVEGYGYGKGYGFVYDTFLHLLQELDRHARAGRHIITVAHECTSNVPNPAGEDFLRYEPRLQSPSSGKASIRHRVKEWVGHLLYIGYDIAVDQNGKATGVGSRCIYTQEMPTWWAKSRSLSDSIVYTDGDAELWNQLLKKGS